MDIPAKDRPDSWSRKTKYLPKGILQLRILNEYGVVRQFEDSPATRLEQKISQAPTAIQDQAEDLQCCADEVQVHAVFERYERLNEFRADRRRDELEERKRCLLADVEGWHQSRRIREYLAVFTAEFEKCCGGPISLKSDAGKWLSWARRYADSLDPLRI